MDLGPIILTVKHAELRPMELGDVDALYEVAQHSGIWQYMPMNVQSIEDMKQFVIKALEAKEIGLVYPFVVVDCRTGNIIGSTRFLSISFPYRHLEIGTTWLTPTYWKSKINTECKYLLLTYCFETLNLIRVQLKTDSRNIRSQKAIEKIGAKKEGIMRNQMFMPDGYYRDSVLYSIIESEWPEAKGKLEEMLGI